MPPKGWKKTEKPKTPATIVQPGDAPPQEEVKIVEQSSGELVKKLEESLALPVDVDGDPLSPPLPPKTIEFAAFCGGATRQAVRECQALAVQAFRILRAALDGGGDPSQVAAAAAILQVAAGGIEIAHVLDETPHPSVQEAFQFVDPDDV